MKIAVDAMGGDHAPREIVRGAVESARSNGLSLILVGQEERIRAELRGIDVSGADIEVLHASEVVEMCEIPAIALRKKRDSSIRVGLRLVADGKASSFVSAGNSGAVMAGGLLILKKTHGVDRPAIAATIPTPHGPVVLIDPARTSSPSRPTFCSSGTWERRTPGRSSGSPGRASASSASAKRNRRGPT